MNKEYWYVDFHDKGIYSWYDENKDFDKACKLVGNYFESFNDAKIVLEQVLSSEVFDENIITQKYFIEVDGEKFYDTESMREDFESQIENLTDLTNI